jgi:hypothetical protein
MMHAPAQASLPARQPFKAISSNHLGCTLLQYMKQLLKGLANGLAYTCTSWETNDLLMW